jgi:hypothetical protein
MAEPKPSTRHRALRDPSDVAGLRRSRAKGNAVRRARRARARARASQQVASGAGMPGAGQSEIATKEQAIGDSAAVARRAGVPQPKDFALLLPNV